MSKQIPLTQGKVAIVDDADYEWLNQWKWFYGKSSSAQGTGYARRWDSSSEKRVLVNMHRVILNAPENFTVDHCDHNGLNNQRSNLRLATTGENNRNTRSHIDSTSKYKGVHYCNTRHQWVATIGHNRKRKIIGYFETEIAAASAYNQHASRLHGDFAMLNNLENHCEPNLFVKSKRPSQPRSSSIRGVYFAKDRKKWRATIVINGKRLNLGTFATEQDAAEAYQKKSVGDSA